jgi:IKI3 family
MFLTLHFKLCPLTPFSLSLLLILLLMDLNLHSKLGIQIQELIRIEKVHQQFNLTSDRISKFVLESNSNPNKMLKNTGNNVVSLVIMIMCFRFRLYLNEKELATNVTSIWLHSDFLLATTLDHRWVEMVELPMGLV